MRELEFRASVFVCESWASTAGTGECWCLRLPLFSPLRIFISMEAACFMRNHLKYLIRRLFVSSLPSSRPPFRRNIFIFEQFPRLRLLAFFSLAHFTPAPFNARLLARNSKYSFKLWLFSFPSGLSFFSVLRRKRSFRPRNRTDPSSKWFQRSGGICGPRRQKLLDAKEVNQPPIKCSHKN